MEIKYVSDNLAYQSCGRCENLQTIRNPYTKELIEVPCGKCNTCFLNKCNQGTLACSLEELTHRYAYFITLTFANEYIPRMYPTIPHPYYDLNGDLCDTQLYSFVDADDPTKVLHEGWYKISYIKNLVKKCNMPDGSLTYLDKKDLQLFLKRLRKNVSKISSAPLRYYAVGEYGPIHFRCHWHIILYFDDRKISEEIISLANKSWWYGRFDISKSRGQTSTYLAGYVNSFTCVPPIFKAKAIRPKCYHSFHFGFADYPQHKKEIYEKGLAYFDEKSFVLHGHSVQPKCQRRLLSFLFPRCVGYASSTVDELRRLYLISDEFKSLFPHVKDKAQRINECYNYFYKCPEAYTIQQSAFFDMILDLSTKQGQFLTNQTYFKAFLYKLFYVSDHFIVFVCDSNPNLYNIRLGQIISFYNELEQRRLSDWYKGLEEYSLIVDNGDYSVYYSNWGLLYADSDDVEDDYSYNRNPIVNMLISQKAMKIYEKTKHRKLNDANKMFNY